MGNAAQLRADASRLHSIMSSLRLIVLYWILTLAFSSDCKISFETVPQRLPAYNASVTRSAVNHIPLGVVNNDLALLFNPSILRDHRGLSDYYFSARMIWVEETKENRACTSAAMAKRRLGKMDMKADIMKRDCVVSHIQRGQRVFDTTVFGKMQNCVARITNWASGKTGGVMDTKITQILEGFPLLQISQLNFIFRPRDGLNTYFEVLMMSYRNASSPDILSDLADDNTLSMLFYFDPALNDYAVTEGMENRQYRLLIDSLCDHASPSASPVDRQYLNLTLPAPRQNPLGDSIVRTLKDKNWAPFLFHSFTGADSPRLLFSYRLFPHVVCELDVDLRYVIAFLLVCCCCCFLVDD